MVDRANYAGHVSRDPALAAALLFRAALRKAGVAVLGGASVGEVPVDAITVATIHSPPISRLVRYMDQQSDNFTAEMLLKQLGLLQAERGTTAAGAQTVTRLLGVDGIPMQGVRFVDGSGLSLLDRITVTALVEILRGLYVDPTLRPFLLRRAAGGRRDGDAERPDEERSAPRQRAREDRDDARGVGAHGNREGTLRVRRRPERASADVLVGARRAGSLRARAHLGLTRAYSVTLV